MQQLSHEVRALVDESPTLLQYKSELVVAGMTCTDSMDGDVSPSLARLRDHERTWNYFQPRKELQLVRLRDSEQAFVKRNILIEITRTSVLFRQLPPVPQWDLPQEWSITVDFTIHRLCMDLEQDLLILTEDRYV